MKPNYEFTNDQAKLLFRIIMDRLEDADPTEGGYTDEHLFKLWELLAIISTYLADVHYNLYYDSHGCRQVGATPPLGFTYDQAQLVRDIVRERKEDELDGVASVSSGIDDLLDGVFEYFAQLYFSV